MAFVSREFGRLGGGGIGVQVAGACAALAETAEVTVVTSARLEPAYRRLARLRHPTIPAGVRFAFVEEPTDEDVGTYYNTLHLYSARVLDRLRELYPDQGPDLIEFSDFLGEGVVTIQARLGRELRFRGTAICVRLHTSAEMCAVLNGHVDDGFEARMTVACERHSLHHADRVIAPSDDVLETYRRFYGPDALAPASTIAPIVAPVGGSNAPLATPPPLADGLRFLYLGRLERRKGVQDLVRALTGVVGRDWSLTLVGGDTDTAPLGGSMRERLELTAGGDPRIELLDDQGRDRIAELIDAHHVVVVPSRWECWPSVVLEAFERNRPVLATPVGGMVEMLADGEAGWLAPGVAEEGLTEAVERLLDEPERIDRAIASEAPRRAYDRLVDPGVLREAYLDLVESLAAPRDLARVGPMRVSAADPLVSVIVPYYGLDRFVEETVRSVFDQVHEPLEAIVVDDGSIGEADARVLGRLAERFPIRVLTQESSGLSRARNAGIAQARGRWVLPLDADNMLHPLFVSRCLEALRHEPDAAFATTWAQFVDEDGVPTEGPRRGFQPIGNSVAAGMADNVAGDATALIRREIFDRGHRYDPELASYEDWQLYRELHRAGLHGIVIPERLLVYRVRDDSMVREVGLPRHGRMFGEMQAKLREGEIEWLCTSAATS